MNYIANLNDFRALTYNYDELLLLPEGNEGLMTFEFLKYANLEERFCCAIQERVDSFKNVAQRFYNSLPVIPLEYLPHFHYSGIVTVAAPVQLHESINIVFLHRQALAQMQDSLNQFVNSGQKLNWFMEHVAKKIDDMQKIICEQNEIWSVNTKTFAEYRNRFRGKKIVIVATGPTLKYYKISSPPPTTQFTSD